MSETLPNIINETLKSHLNVGPSKAVAYLPTKTIETVIGIPVSAYRSMVEQAGNTCVVVSADRSYIVSGAVYSYNEPALTTILNSNTALLARHGWPADPEGFVRRLALEHLPEESPLMPVVKAAFGD